MTAIWQIKASKEVLSLRWQDYEDVSIVYQPSSSETHVFNEITSTTISLLENPFSDIAQLHRKLTEELEIGLDELGINDVNFVVGRLEELGLIDWLETEHPDS